jgi:hypothetical protein
LDVADSVIESNGQGIVLVDATTATISRSRISGNSTGIALAAVSKIGAEATITDTDIVANGVAIYATGGGATMRRATVSGNIIAIHAIANALNARGAGAIVEDSTIEGNGLGILLGGNGATATLTRTTMSGNLGGAISSTSGRVTLSNTTISGNRAYAGAAIFSQVGSVGFSTLTLRSVTITANASDTTGAVALRGAVTFTVTNTIIAGNTGASARNCDVENVVNDLGYNLEFPGTSCGFALPTDVRADPLLRPLAHNGGPTQTHGLTIGSPAIDNGDDHACAAPPVAAIDQRGASRLTGSHCDIGAYEAATVPFTDDPLSVRLSLIRAKHVTELRTSVEDLRERYALPSPTWRDQIVIGGVVQTAHIQELRRALLDVYDAVGRPRPSFSDAVLTPGVTTINASHIEELRSAVAAFDSPP